MSAKPAEPFLVRHATAAVGLNLDGNETPVLDARLPDRHGPAVELSARPDVRRKGTDASIELVGRPREVELAVCGGELIRVGHAVRRLRPEGRWVESERFVDELGRDRRRLGID